MPIFGGDNADSYYDEGLTASKRGDLARAIEFFEKCIRKDNTYSAAYHQLGKVYHRLGQFQKAATFLSQVVAKKPDQVPPRADLGYTHLCLGNVEKARELFSDVCAMSPGHARATLGLAHSAYLAGNKDVAIHIAQDQANSSGATFGTYYLLARAASEGGREELVPEAIQRADKLIEKSIETSPDQPEGFYLRGALMDLLGDKIKAEEFYQQAVDHAQPDKHYAAYEEHFALTDMLGRLALVQLQLGKDDAGNATLERLRELDPESPYLPRDGAPE